MAKPIRSWTELVDLESKYYRLDININDCDGWIIPKHETEETLYDYWRHHRYLSTHTFCDESCKKYTALLQQYGFDVEIDN